MRTGPPGGALVLDAGSGRGALAACRDLSSCGWRVGVGSPGGHPLIGHSRAVSAAHDVPWPEHDLQDFAQRLNELVDTTGYRVVMPGGDNWMSALAQLDGDLGVAVAQPSTTAVERVLDKLWLARTASEVGLLTPRTERATEDVIARWPGAMMIKTRRHVLLGAADPSTRIEALRTSDRAAALRRAVAIEASGGEPIVQAALDGAVLEAVVGVRAGHRWLARAQQRTPGVWPWPAGSTSWSSTTTCDDELFDAVGGLLDRAGWEGLAEVELLRTADGRPHVIDVNGRIYGGMALSAAAGLHLADLAGRLAVARREDEPLPEPIGDARAGVRFCWLEGEVRRAIAMAPDARSAGRGVAAATLRSCRAEAHPVGAIADPGPAVAVLGDLTRRTVVKIRNAVPSGQGTVLLVDDGERRGGLAAARRLGSAGWTVAVATTAPAARAQRGLTASSRHVSRVLTTPPLAEGIDQFLAGVERAIVEVGADVVFPTDDPEILALSWGRDRLSGTVPYPPHECVLAVHDKVLVSHRAGDQGVATPDTIDLAPDGSDDRSAIAALPGPWVVKTRLQWDAETSPVPQRWQTVVARHPIEAGAAIDRIRSEGGRPFLQAHTPGDLLALSLVIDRDGRPRAAVQGAGPALTWPPQAGPRVRSRTVTVDPELLRRCTALLVDMGWWGLADVDFLVPADRIPRLIDINGRFFGSMAIAAGSGVDLAHAWASVASGRTLPDECITGRPDARWQWLEADLRRALVERRGGLLVDLASTVAVAPRANHAIFDPRDPVPWLVHNTELVGRVRRRAGRGRS